MGLGASIIIFAIGAILTFGVTVSAEGIDLDAIGVILMIVGIVGALVSALFLMSWAPYRTVFRERTVTDPHPHDHTHEPHVH